MKNKIITLVALVIMLFVLVPLTQAQTRKICWIITDIGGARHRLCYSKENKAFFLNQLKVTRFNVSIKNLDGKSHIKTAEGNFLCQISKKDLKRIKKLQGKTKEK